jgi:endonuclease V-like protein UPF0215 family
MNFDEMMTFISNRLDRIENKLDTTLKDHENRISLIEGSLKTEQRINKIVYTVVGIVISTLILFTSLKII